MPCGSFREETGFTADEIISLGEEAPRSPEAFRPKRCISISRAASTAGKSHLDEGEFLSVEKHHIDELTQLVMDGKIADGKTVIAVLEGKTPAWRARNSYDLFTLLIAFAYALCYNNKPVREYLRKV